jgi:uncharacterized protein (DUF305 family)
MCPTPRDGVVRGAPCEAVGVADATDTDERDDTPETGDGDVVVLPWWRNPVNLVVLALAGVLLAGALGYVVGNNRAIPDANDTDVGFLQDMRIHHEQAVQMSLIYLDRPETDLDLRTIAREILVGQNRDIGRMIQLLRDVGEPEVDDTGLVMGWMGQPIPVERMPGLASDDDITALTRCAGRACDEIFVQLMTVHHEGGVHMAEHAVEHASMDEVRLMAEQIVTLQREEIVELEVLLDRGGTATSGGTSG